MKSPDIPLKIVLKKLRRDKLIPEEKIQELEDFFRNLDPEQINEVFTQIERFAKEK